MTAFRVDLIAGARPNFMKIAPIVHALDARKASGDTPTIDYRIVHTGQHYDAAMSDAFFDQLGIPQPDVNLGVGSGSHATQTGKIMTGYENLLESGDRPHLCIVVGDVNSTMACAITAQKLHVQVAHVEGGLRSGDWSMPEEINRLATDAVSDWFFTTSEHANRNLREAGVEDDRIVFVGNTMIDTLVGNLERLRPPAFWDELELDERPYVLMTLHRPANVDNPDRLSRWLRAVATGAGKRPVIFPAHPRTRGKLDRLADDLPTLNVVPPQPYLEFLYLVRNATVVATDSGGLTEETTVLGVPCLTLRTSTERPETIDQGTNQLIGDDDELLAKEIAKAFSQPRAAAETPPLWDGKAAARIVSALASILPR